MESVTKTFTDPRDMAIAVPIDNPLATAPTLILTPTAQRTSGTATAGSRYRRLVQIANNTGGAMVNFDYAIEVANSHEIVAAGQALASGDDLRVVRDGEEIPRILKDWNAGTALVWIRIPQLLDGETLDVELWYGNPDAGPPTAFDAQDEPAFDPAISTNSLWKYPTDDVAANAGLGGWFLSDDDLAPIDTITDVPGAWRWITTRDSPDAHWQDRYTAYVDTATYYQAKFRAMRARGGGLAAEPQSTDADGVALYHPGGISNVRVGIEWSNDYARGASGDAIGRVAILSSRNAITWTTVEDWSAVQETIATEPVADYAISPAAPFLAFAVLPPNEQSRISSNVTTGRKVYGAWHTTLEVAVDDSGITQTSDAWTIASVADMAFWHKADAIAQADNTAVASWTDSSGNGRHAANATGTEQPTLQTNEVNGLAVVRFDGVDNDLGIASHGLTKPCTIFTVAKVNAGNVANDRIINATNLRVEIGGAGINDFLMNGGSSFQYSTDTQNNATHLHTNIFRATGNSTGGVDGTHASGAAGAGAIGATITYGSSGAANWINMDLCEVVAYNGELSQADYERIEGSLAHKWGLAANLPASHPYKDAAPTTAPLAAEEEIYEFATEVRLGGDTELVAPWTAIRVGGEDDSRIAIGIGENLVVELGERAAAIWNAAMTVKLADASPLGVQAVQMAEGMNVEHAAGAWLEIAPYINPLANPDFESGAANWTRGDVAAGATVAAFFATGGRGFSHVSASSVAADTSVVEEIADDYIPVAGRSRVHVAADLDTTNANLISRLTIWFYDSAQVEVSSSMAAEWAPSAGVVFRRVHSAAPPRRAAYYRVGTTVFDTVGSQTGFVAIDNVAPGGNELIVTEAALNELDVTVEWQEQFG